MDSVTVFVAAKGVLLQTSVINLSYKTALFSIKPDIRHFPKFTVVAAYLLDNKVISKEVTIEVKNAMNNFVSLSLKLRLQKYT